MRLRSIWPHGLQIDWSPASRDDLRDIVSFRNFRHIQMKQRGNLPGERGSTKRPYEQTPTSTATPKIEASGYDPLRLVPRHTLEMDLS